LKLLGEEIDLGFAQGASHDMGHLAAEEGTRVGAEKATHVTIPPCDSTRFFICKEEI
jgi:hypothetical protein